MADFTVFTNKLNSSSIDIKNLSGSVNREKNRVDMVNSSLSFEVKQKSNISKNLRTISADLSAISVSLKSASSVLNNAVRYYNKTEQENVALLSKAQAKGSGKGNSSSNPYKDIYKAYDSLPKEWQEFIDMVLGAVVGSEASALTKLLLKLFSGNLKWKDAWDVASVGGGLIAEKMGFSHFGVAFTAFKTFLTGDYLAQINRADKLPPIQSLFTQFVIEGKLLVDTSCKLVDSAFGLSKINTAFKIINKVDIGQGVNAYGKLVNTYWDQLTSGGIFKSSGQKQIISAFGKLFDKNTYSIKR